MLLRKKGFLITIMIVGILLAATGFLIRSEALKSVSGICVGIGAGLFGMSGSNLIVLHCEKKRPELKKQIEIERKDERHRTIHDKAKAKAGDVMQWLVIAQIFLLILFDFPLWLIFTAVGIYITYYVVMFVLTAKYNKEM